MNEQAPGIPRTGWGCVAAWAVQPRPRAEAIEHPSKCPTCDRTGNAWVGLFGRGWKWLLLTNSLSCRHPQPNTLWCLICTLRLAQPYVFSEGECPIGKRIPAENGHIYKSKCVICLYLLLQAGFPYGTHSLEYLLQVITNAPPTVNAFKRKVAVLLIFTLILFVLHIFCFQGNWKPPRRMLILHPSSLSLSTDTSNIKEF